MNGNIATSDHVCVVISAPHSLGKLIEWKLSPDRSHQISIAPPHSLGRLIEWKLFHHLIGVGQTFSAPHSLGKLIEWKRERGIGTVKGAVTPHSLGKLIEWKRERGIGTVKGAVTPHSLGKLIEWKQTDTKCLSKNTASRLPTRWGN